jgi:uncharacterized membrane protein YGL010W
MKTLTDHLASYAAYHRDPRNLVTHFIGVPPIVLAVTILLSRPVFNVGDFSLTPAMLVAALASLFYLRLHVGLGALLAALLAVCCTIGLGVASGSTTTWLSWGFGLFISGWIVQFIGHYFEGKKPAFVDDLVGLLQGPLFLLAEALFMLGWGKTIQATIEQRVGPIKRRDMKRA